MGLISSKDVKTRKEHNCFGCDRKFPKGSILERITGTDGDSISTNYWCGTCKRYWNKYMDSDDSINFGELKSEDNSGWEATRIEVEGECEESTF